MINLMIILFLIAFVSLMAYWIAKSEESSKQKETQFLDPNKSYKKAQEIGLATPGQYKDALPGV